MNDDYICHEPVISYKKKTMIPERKDGHPEMNIRDEDIKTRYISNIFFSDDYFWLCNLTIIKTQKEESTR